MDFSDRVHSKRRAYRISSRRARSGVLVQGNEDTGEEWNSDDDEEGLDRRLVRLLRETQEVQAELDKRSINATETTSLQDAEKEPGNGQEDADVSTKFRELNAALDKIRNSQINAGSAHAKLVKQLASGLTEQNGAPIDDSSISSTTSPPATDATTIAKIADFDSRLASLERALGPSSLDTPATNPFTPILPTLSLLDRQITLLSSVPSQPHLDSVIQKLQLAQTATHPANPPTAADSNNSTAVAPSALSPEDMAKLRSLYSILPQLTSMAPTLPPLLARLRSLRTLHATAATASQTLDAIERKQDEADREIKEWTAGLANVTEAVKSAEGGMRENVGALDSWVKDLEERVKQLG